MSGDDQNVISLFQNKMLTRRGEELSGDDQNVISLFEQHLRLIRPWLRKQPINVDHMSEIPKFAEPFFLTFNADCEFRIAMTPEDLDRAGLAELGEKWG